jgi:hypothetical protein
MGIAAIILCFAFSSYRVAAPHFAETDFAGRRMVKRVHLSEVQMQTQTTNDGEP